MGVGVGVGVGGRDLVLILYLTFLGGLKAVVEVRRLYASSMVRSSVRVMFYILVSLGRGGIEVLVWWNYLSL